ncbi:hypothetical protein BSL78_19991 [Apostichopus japonicus]|uniref:Uncharacterized protein n=1 Tax=Stichopus japonicus TaxID=307972 RepID=A0A2G8K570_STIJA|nr:hypothetical protein BSL78_19991 [Apostichopus japonicus]
MLCPGTARPRRVDPFTTNMRQDFPHVRQTSDRLVCDTRQQWAAHLLFQVVPPAGLPITVAPGPCRVTDWRLTSSPLGMISQVLREIRRSRGRFTTVVHSGPADPGLGRFSSSSRTPRRSCRTHHICCPRDGGSWLNPDSKGLQLVAWKLSGLPSDREDFCRQRENNRGDLRFPLLRFEVCRTRQTLPT